MDPLELQAEHAAEQLGAVVRDWMGDLDEQEPRKLFDLLNRVAALEQCALDAASAPLIAYLAMLGIHHVFGQRREVEEP